MMTVKQLIEALQLMPDYYECVIDDVMLGKCKVIGVCKLDATRVLIED